MTTFEIVTMIVVYLTFALLGRFSNIDDSRTDVARVDGGPISTMFGVLFLFSLIMFWIYIGAWWSIFIHIAITLLTGGIAFFILISDFARLLAFIGFIISMILLTISIFI